MSEETILPDSSKKCDKVFDDNLGKDVIQSFDNVKQEIEVLYENLEKQFMETEEPEHESDPILTDSGHSITEKEQMEDIINLLNEQHSESSEEHFNNPSFDELEILSKVKYGGFLDPDTTENEMQTFNDEFEEVETSLSSKIFELVDSMKNRVVAVDDEWENDDDTGYVTVTLTDQEFFDYEDRNAAVLVAERQAISNGSERKEELKAKENEKNESDDCEGKENLSTEDFASINPFLSMEKDLGVFGEELIQAPEPKRQSAGERRRSEIIGQHRFQGADGTHCYFNLKIIFEPYKTGFEESKDLKHPKGTILAGRYEVYDVLGSAAFSTALQCIDLAAEENEAQWVCLKVIKNNKDYFDQSLDEIKLLQYINSRGEPDQHHVLRLIDFFYCKEHLFIVSELLKENLYEFGRYIKENDLEIYYTLPRLKRISKQVLEALAFIHSLKLIHCDVKPENIVIKSFSRCEVKLIDFGSSCFTTDHLTTYIQSRSYRAPEVILGHSYDSRIDIWSVGAVIAELYTGYVLFQNDSVATMLSRITGILGPFPESILANGRDTGKYFTLSNIVYERDDDGAFHLIFPKKTDLRTRLHFSAHPEDQTEDENLFVDFIRSLLDTNPTKRPTAEEALKHPWLSDADTVSFSEYIIGQPAVPAKEDEDDEEGLIVGDGAERSYYSGYDYVEETLEENDDEDDSSRSSDEDTQGSESITKE